MGSGECPSLELNNKNTVFEKLSDIEDTVQYDISIYTHMYFKNF